MKNCILKILFITLISFSFIGCSDDDEIIPNNKPDITPPGAFILNNGEWKGNNANLAYYNTSKKEFTDQVFFKMNDQKLGELAQDMAIYNGKIYITVTGSNKIFITDLKLQLLKTLSPMKGNQPQEPRYILPHNGKIYVTTQSASVLCIDPASMEIEKEENVIAWPEQMAVVNNRLYVTNSRKPNNKISVIDLATFKVVDEIEVEVNPEKITSDKNGNIYVISTGDYETIKPAFQKIDPNTKEVTVIGTDVATQMKVNGDKIYFIYKDPFVWDAASLLYYYDITEAKVVKESFVNVPKNVDLKDANSISIDPTNGDIYISTSDYTTKGSMYIFSKDGSYISKLGTEGINPMGAFFLTETK